MPLSRRCLRSSTASTLLLALLALGCSDPLSPRDVEGRYALERVGGDPLPVSWSGPADAPGRLLAAEIVLSADGSAQTVFRVEEDWGPEAPRVVEHRSWWVFEIDGARLTLRPPLCRALDCLAASERMELMVFGDVLLASGDLFYRRADVVAP